MSIDSGRVTESEKNQLVVNHEGYEVVPMVVCILLLLFMRWRGKGGERRT